MKAKVKTKLKMMYWRGKKFWVGKLIDHPEIMTQGGTLEELEENMIDAYRISSLPHPRISLAALTIFSALGR